MNKSLSIEQFSATFTAVYSFLYDHCDNVPGYREAVNAFDDFLSKHKDFVLEFNRYRGDVVSSDREAAAFVFTLDSML